MHDHEKDPFSDKAAQWDARPLVRDLVVAAAGVSGLLLFPRLLYLELSEWKNEEANIEFSFCSLPFHCRL
jgi:hypothetical protein